MYTIVPVKSVQWNSASLKYALLWLPVIGLFFGLVLYGCTLLILPTFLQSVLFVLLLNGLSGFIHIDGFMDCSDAFGSYKSKEEKVKILKDVHVGAFSVVHLLFALLIQVASVHALLMRSGTLLYLLAIPVMSRVLSASALYFGHVLETSTLAKQFQSVALSNKVVIIFLFLVTSAFFILFGVKGFAMVGVALLTWIYIQWKAYHEFGGINGDVLGYLIVSIETIMLLIAVIVGGIV